MIISEEKREELWNKMEKFKIYITDYAYQEWLNSIGVVIQNPMDVSELMFDNTYIEIMEFIMRNWDKYLSDQMIFEIVSWFNTLSDIEGKGGQLKYVNGFVLFSGKINGVDYSDMDIKQVLKMI